MTMPSISVWLDGDRFVAVSPAVPGVRGIGDTAAEARHRLRVAVESMSGAIEWRADGDGRHIAVFGVYKIVLEPPWQWTLFRDDGEEADSGVEASLEAAMEMAEEVVRWHADRDAEFFLPFGSDPM